MQFAQEALRLTRHAPSLAGENASRRIGFRLAFGNNVRLRVLDAQVDMFAHDLQARGRAAVPAREFEQRLGGMNGVLRLRSLRPAPISLSLAGQFSHLGGEAFQRGRTSSAPVAMAGPKRHSTPSGWTSRASPLREAARRVPGR